MNFPVYVISLTHATERRADIALRLDAAGVNYEITDAVDGAKLKLEEYKDRVTHDLSHRRGAGDLLHGEIGATLSHYNLWERMIAEQTPFAMILEDDAIWEDDFFDCAKAIVESPCYWNIAHLAAPYKGKVISVIDVVGNRQLVRYKHPQCYASAYLIDLDGAKKLHSFYHKIRDVIDQQWMLYWLPNVYFYHLHPPAATSVDVDASFVGDRPPKKTKDQRRKKLGRFRYWLYANNKRYARRIYHWTHPRKIRRERIIAQTPKG